MRIRAGCGAEVPILFGAEVVEPYGDNFALRFLGDSRVIERPEGIKRNIRIHDGEFDPGSG